MRIAGMRCANMLFAQGNRISPSRQLHYSVHESAVASMSRKSGVLNIIAVQHDVRAFCVCEARRTMLRQANFYNNETPEPSSVAMGFSILSHVSNNYLLDQNNQNKSYHRY